MWQLREVDQGQRKVQHRCDDLDGHAVGHGETSTQRFMPAYDFIERAGQRINVQLSRQVQRGCYIVERVAGLELIEKPQPLLGIRQRQILAAFNWRQFRRTRGSCVLFDQHCQQRHCRRLEQQAQWRFHARLAAQLRYHLRCKQRVASQRKEIVIHADLRDFQHVSPDGGQFALQRSAWRDVLAPARLGVRRRQRLPIHLAVWRQRHGIEPDEMGRHHVLRQHLQQGAACRIGAHLAGQVGHQPSLAPHCTRQHNGFAHVRQRTERSLDLAKLDAKAPDLDLAVEPAQVVDTAVGQVASKVTGTVQARARNIRKWMGNEFLRRELRAVQVAAREAGTGNVQLPHHTDRHRIHGLVENEDCHVRQWTADHRALRGRVQRRRRVVGIRHVPCFGQAVQIEQLRVRQDGAELAQQLVGQCFSSGRPETQRREPVGQVRVSIQQCFEQRRHQPEMGHAARRQGSEQALVIEQLVRRYQHRRHALQQIAESLPQRIDEVDRRLVAADGARCERMALPQPAEAVDDLAMRHSHAFRLAGGAGAVDRIRQMVGT